MKQTTKEILKKYYTATMLVIIVLSMAGSMIMLASQGADTRRIADSTNKLVQSQTEILGAIKQVAIDTKLTAEQQTKIIICMLQVPQFERTTDLQKKCRKDAIAVDTFDNTSQETVGPVAASKGGVSSSKHSTHKKSSQPKSPQKPLLVVPQPCVELGGLQIC